MIHHHLVLPNELNHFGTLFGGAAMAAADKASYIEATLLFPEATFVTKATGEFNFIGPARSGDILEITTTPAHVGESAVKIKIVARNTKTKDLVFETHFIFVHVENGHKAPIPGAEEYEKPSQTITGEYTNWKGETKERVIIPQAIRFTSTTWHPKPQWILEATDTKSGQIKGFALKDFNFKDNAH